MPAKAAMNDEIHERLGVCSEHVKTEVLDWVQGACSQQLDFQQI